MIFKCAVVTHTWRVWSKDKFKVCCIVLVHDGLAKFILIFERASRRHVQIIVLFFFIFFFFFPFDVVCSQLPIISSYTREKQFIFIMIKSKRAWRKHGGFNRSRSVCFKWWSQMPGNIWWLLWRNNVFPSVRGEILWWSWSTTWLCS